LKEILNEALADVPSRGWGGMSGNA
jgi:hypothetical protein